MTVYRFEIKASGTSERLDKVLAEKLDEVINGGFSRKKTKKLIDANKVMRNGTVERMASHTLRYGEILEVDVDPGIVGPTKSYQNFNLRPGDILWEDQFLIAIDKPTGLPSQATKDPKRDHAVASVRRYLEWKGVDDPYVAIHHRLDVGTSGVLVFACDERANEGLARAFRERLAKKSYLVLAVADDKGFGRSEGEQWSVENHLDGGRRGSREAQIAVRSGGDYAETEFEVRRVSQRLHEIEARPKTGRRHQIRAHLADEGLPIVGDERYGGVDAVFGHDVQRMMLHAHRLALPHPVHDESIEIVSDVPDAFDAVWTHS